MTADRVAPSHRYPIDKRLPTPAYLQLRDGIARAIETGELAPGSALPSERELAQRLNLSRMTVRRAFEELVAANLVEQRQGSGTYVLARRHEQAVDCLLGFFSEAKILGVVPGSRLLGHDYVPADQHVADALSVTKGSRVLMISRLRMADGDPLVIQIAHLSPALAEFPVERLANGDSLYRVVEQRYGIEPVYAKQTVIARPPSKEEARLLDIERDVPVLELERTTYGQAHAPFEYVKSAYRSDKYQIAFALRAAARQ